MDRGGPQVVAVDDPDDPRVDDYRSLRDPELRRRYEGERGVFIAESPHALAALATSTYPIRSVLCEQRRLDHVLGLVGRRPVPVYVAERSVIRAVIRFRMHQGVVACAERLRPATLDAVLGAALAAGAAARVAVLEEANDHENLGVVFRSARALGVHGVVLGPRSADPLYRRCVRVSMGHVLHVPHVTVDDLGMALDAIAAAGFTTVALTPGATGRPLDAVAGDRPLALVLGAEGPGLQRATIDRADVTARIPIVDEVDSLNVAVAASIAFHVLRPR